ncbi:MAG TPA: hypothetical protein VMX17_00465 [Candidatus Glassbacteria bacterium]|nr:hypothetical protein [Candidatus Glassbacteria bacterium]
MADIFTCTFPVSAFLVKDCAVVPDLPEELHANEPCDPVSSVTETIIDPYCDDTVGINGGIIDGILFPSTVEPHD